MKNHFDCLFRKEVRHKMELELSRPPLNTCLSQFSTMLSTYICAHYIHAKNPSNLKIKSQGNVLNIFNVS